MNPTPHKETKETFFNRVKGLLAPSEIIDIEVAYTLAKHAHRSQKRKELDQVGNPVRYFEHCRQAAIVAMDIGFLYDKNIIVSCLLHDTIEDTQEVSIEMIDRVFGAETAKAVMLVTKTDDVSSELYYKRICRNKTALKVKLSDRISNFQTLSTLETDFVKKQIEKTKNFISHIHIENSDDSIIRLKMELLNQIVLAQKQLKHENPKNF